MRINKDTTVCISIAEKPGNLGSCIFNTAFEQLSLNYIYKPFRVDRGNLKMAVDAIRVFNIRGCGVSMPHKIAIIKYLDDVDQIVLEIDAVNTVVNTDGVLKGYNADFDGARKILSMDYDVKGKRTLIIGSGGVAKAIIAALKHNGAGAIYVCSRDDSKAKNIAKKFNASYHPYNEKDDFSGDLLVNATPVGMSSGDNCIVESSTIDRFEAVMDVVVSNKKTPIIARAEALRKTVLPGYKMAVHQALAQFFLYTGQNISEEIINQAIQEYFLA